MSEPIVPASGAAEEPSNFVKNAGMLSCEITDKADLYSAYMPFVKRGGLFIATDFNYTLGDQVLLSLLLMDEPLKISITGTVVWVTPAHAQSNRVQGVGLQFNEEGSTSVRNKIETYLAGALQSDRPTHTL